LSEARASERSDIDAGEAGDGRNDMPMGVATDMTPAATPTATDATIFELLERNENRKRRWKSEAPATALAPNDWRSRMERTMRQQAQELTQLHLTVGHLTNLLQAQAARKAAQWFGMRMSIQEREQKWHAHHEDDKLWGGGITNMIAMVMKAVAPGQEAIEKKTDETAGMDGGGLEASQHADTAQEGGPEQHKQLQQLPKPRLPLKVQPKSQHEPKPKSAPTPMRWWETVPPRTESQRAPIGPGGPSTTERCLILMRGPNVPLPGPAPTPGSSMADRRLILWWDERFPPPRKMDEEIASAVNIALFQEQSAANVRIMNARRNAKGKGTEGLQTLREVIQAENKGVAIPAQVRWLLNPRIIREREHSGEIKASSVVFIVRGKKVAQRLVNKGVIAAGVRYKVELYTNAGPNSLCKLCCGWGHIKSKCSHHQP